ncbi:MAG: hypothetical protein KAT65_04180, partial [Methanophagales archaeon]|nr:hypothetical protein [Methanophagales archaeon]
YWGVEFSAYHHNHIIIGRSNTPIIILGILDILVLKGGICLHSQYLTKVRKLTTTPLHHAS